MLGLRDVRDDVLQYVASGVSGVNTVSLKNVSGLAVTKGMIVIGAVDGFTTTTTASHTGVIGVVHDTTIASGTYGKIAVGGLVNIQAQAGEIGRHSLNSSHDETSRMPSSA